MSAAQALHDKLKALAEEFESAPGVAYPLAAIGGALGHLKAAIRKEPKTPPVAEVTTLADSEPVTVPVVAEEPIAPVVAPSAPPAKPAPVVQVARPKTPAS